MRALRLVLPGSALLILAASGCSTDLHRAPEPAAASDRPAIPQPIDLRTGAPADESINEARKAWIEEMHRTAPDVDWRAIERENGRIEQQRRNLIAETATSGATQWSEVGSSNQAGRMHVAVISPDGQKLYAGSALGGVWRAVLDGSGWEPLGDNLYGGVNDLLVLPGENMGEPDVMVAVTDLGLVHVSRDEGMIWEEPPGASDLVSVRGVAVLNDASSTILIYGRGPSTDDRPTVLASTDYGRTFTPRWQGTTSWSGYMWVPRTGPGSANEVYVIDSGLLRRSVDGGFTFPSITAVELGSTRAVLTGSEAGGPTLYAAFLVGGQWKLYRSADGGQSFTFKYILDDFNFFESLGTSILNDDLVFYGGVDCYRSDDGGATFTMVNSWMDYYDDPVTQLHADIFGLHCWPDATSPSQESCYASTDGGTYVSHDGLSTVQNLSLSGLAVSQYYSTLSSRVNWDRLSAGSQDQGYQAGTVQHTEESGPSTPMDQLIAGDWGHLTSNDETDTLIFASYPFFILAQGGPTEPLQELLTLPAGSDAAFLPPLAADPTVPGTFFLGAELLYRYDRTSATEWVPIQHSDQVFGGPSVDGSFISALAIAPTDPDRFYAINNAGRIFFSVDHGVTWTESEETAPPQQFFYGNAIAVHPEDPLEVTIGGSGYSGPGVIRSTDGGQSWSAESFGLPQTLVYALVYAEDGSGDLYAGTETGAHRWDRQIGLWQNIMGNESPATIYWSAEVVNDGGTIRYGTYGRGVWDYARVAGDRDADGIPDGEDVCANNFDPEQPDGDTDGAGDACDNCVDVANPGQADDDSDAHGNACDCEPQDAGVFAIPPDVPGLIWVTATRMEWDSVAPEAGNATSYRMYRGTLGEFPVGSSSDCTVFNPLGTSQTDASIPASGEGFWYLVQGSNTCGAGTLGTWGADLERDVPVCTP